MSSRDHSLVGSAGRGPVGRSERYSLRLVMLVWVRPIMLSLASHSDGFFFCFRSLVEPALLLERDSLTPNPFIFSCISSGRYGFVGLPNYLLGPAVGALRKHVDAAT